MSEDQRDFDAAAAVADRSMIGRLGWRMWHVSWLPSRVRVWGMGRWNLRYRRALADRTKP